jgi:hypothetical protein
LIGVSDTSEDGKAQTLDIDVQVLDARVFVAPTDVDVEKGMFLQYGLMSGDN